MKSICTFLSFVILFTAVSFNSNGQDCSDLIISEVLEGWSNNKAIEIYNPTATAIDASEYGLVRFQNGNTVPGNITFLEGAIIAPYDVYVVVIDKRDPDGLSFEAPVWDELQLQADAFITPEYNNGVEVMYFNGNDAIALLKDDGAQLVDVFGKIGEGTDFPGWGGYLDDAGEQAYVSQDHTLTRKANVMSGYTTPPVSFDILNEYDSLPANSFEMLGFHLCDCDVNSIEESLVENKLKVFPNPASEAQVTLAVNGKMISYSIYGITGNLIETNDLDKVQSALISLTDIPAGTYYIKARLESGIEVSQVLLKK